MAYDISPTGIAQPVVIVNPTVAGGGTGNSAPGLPVTPTVSANSATTRVASIATDTVILAANTARRGASVYNSDTNPLQLLLASGVSSATNFTIQLATNTYFEVPFGYTGVIKGIWTVIGSGAAQVTEYS
jgi:hypothetical protein